MKRISLLAFAIAFAASNLQAQDTLYLNGLKEGYYNNEVWMSGYPEVAWSIAMMGDDISAFASFFQTKEELKIYGIAAILFTVHFYGPETYVERETAHTFDTCFEHVEENLRLYRYAGGNMAMHPEELPVNIRRTPPTYYLKFDTLDIFSMFDPHNELAFPVYERYFETPTVVTDTFYVGVSNFGNHYYDEENGIKLRWWLNYPIFAGFPYDFDRTYTTAQQKVADSSWEYLPPIAQPFFFPILTPGENTVDTTQVDPDDTTHVEPGDTVGINTVRLLERYVSVMPNPATERVQVLSSFGLRRVEVFNAAGRKVMDLKAEGLKATLDVSKLPSGAYLLRIHTPQGVTTKKLVVR